MVHALRGAPDDGAHERVNDWQTYSRRLSARTARLAGPLLRIRRSGSPRQRTCGQGEARTRALSSESCSVGIASEAFQAGLGVILVSRHPHHPALNVAVAGPSLQPASYM